MGRDLSIAEALKIRARFTHRWSGSIKHRFSRNRLIGIEMYTISKIEYIMFQHFGNVTIRQPLFVHWTASLLLYTPTFFGDRSASCVFSSSGHPQLNPHHPFQLASSLRIRARPSSIGILHFRVHRSGLIGRCMRDGKRTEIQQGGSRIVSSPKINRPWIPQQCDAESVLKVVQLPEWHERSYVDWISCILMGVWKGRDCNRGLVMEINGKRKIMGGKSTHRKQRK